MHHYFGSKDQLFLAAVEALREVGGSPEATGTMWVDVGVVAGAALLALGLAAATLRRRTN